MRGLEKDRNPGSSENVDKERGDSLEGRTNKVNETHKRQKPKNMLEPRGLEVVEPAKKLMPYVEVPPLRTRPISGGKIKVPEKTPVQAPMVRSSHALKQARKELILGIIKEIFSIPHPYNPPNLQSTMYSTQASYTYMLPHDDTETSLARLCTQHAARDAAKVAQERKGIKLDTKANKQALVDAQFEDAVEDGSSC